MAKPKKAAARKPAAAAAAADPDPVTWSPKVLAHVAAAESGFAAAMRALGGKRGAAWEHAPGAEMVGLERWGSALAALDRRAGVAALVAAAQHGFPLVVAHAGKGIRNMGFLAREPSLDGAPVEAQLERAAGWLADASTLPAVQRALDPGRQLNAWDADLHPDPGNAWFWYSEVGQCACSAVVRADSAKVGRGGSYYTWPARACVGRGLVIAARGLLRGGSRPAGVIDALGSAIAAAFS